MLLRGEQRPHRATLRRLRSVLVLLAVCDLSTRALYLLRHVLPDIHRYSLSTPQPRQSCDGRGAALWIVGRQRPGPVSASRPADRICGQLQALWIASEHLVCPGGSARLRLDTYSSQHLSPSVLRRRGLRGQDWTESGVQERCLRCRVFQDRRGPDATTAADSFFTTG